PLHTPRLAPRSTRRVIQSRSAASFLPLGAATAGTTTPSGWGASPASTSANEKSGTTASPPDSIAVGRLADTVYGKNSCERAKTSYGPNASVMTDPLAPSTTATASRPSGTGRAGGQPGAGATWGGRGGGLAHGARAPGG